MGTDLVFSDGLVVLRADNSTGKSTSLQAIVFALGLEGMLSPSRAIPLPHSMTHRITDPATGRDVPVLESEVLLEIEGPNGRIATIRRHSHHPNISPNLITVFESPGLSLNRWEDRRDYFVRLPGAAQRESGFHHWLADFLKWELPEVPRFNSTPINLYLETIFPLFIVEQKRGWSGVLSRIPTYLQIRDVTKRAVEFVLSLRVSEIALYRQRLEVEAQDLRLQWQAVAVQVIDAARRLGGVVDNLPSSPVSTWPPSAPVNVLLPTGDSWIGIQDQATSVEAELAQLRSREVPQTQEAAPEVEERLRELTMELASVGELYGSYDRDLGLDNSELASLQSRRHHLAEELRRIQDALLLHRLGSPLRDWIEIEECPTCHQHFPEILLSNSADLQLVPLEASEERTRQQLSLVRALQADLEVTVEAKRAKHEALDVRVQELQRSIRSLRQTLVAPDRAPSIAHVQRIVELELRSDALSDAAAMVGRVVADLGPLASEWRRVQTALQGLRDVELAEDDEDKLRRLEELIVDQLEEYGFRSLPAGEIRISLERYTPVHEGFDLGFDLSASDMIRLIWAYSMALLELCREVDANHLGLLLFDEPRQQSTDPVAFRSLLRRAADASSFGQQVIFATSEPDVAVRSMLEGVEHSYLSFDGFMIRRLDA